MFGALLPLIEGVTSSADIVRKAENFYFKYQWTTLRNLVASDPYLMRIKEIASGAGLNWESFLAQLATEGVSGSLAWVPERFFGTQPLVTVAATPAPITTSALATRSTTSSLLPTSGTLTTLQAAARTAIAQEEGIPTWAWVVGGAAVAGGLWMILRK